ncbi:MAG: di-heme enzyme [Chitinophagaceae bacterium BSSC1]|nr:MAG: di-heme enzyme [Chitinophagaceae bacterium BSSC1]
MKSSYLQTIQKTSMGIFLLGLMITVCSFYVSKNSKQDQSKKNIGSVKIALGHWLFFDNRLSYNQQKSCASCHDPKFCFSDGYRTSAGTDGFNVKHNAPSLINIVFVDHLTWADSSIHNLAQQMRNPMFNEAPRELGIKGHETLVLDNLAADPYYQKAFKEAFPNEPSPIKIGNVINAITAYETILTSFNSKYDRYLKGNKKAMNPQELAGLKLYQSDRLQCATCHDHPTRYQRQELVYANTGLYNVAGNYPLEDQGLFDITRNLEDRGKFRIPSLKNVMLTAPYTHNGSVQTISEMIDIYAAGGRNISDGPFKGNGSQHPNKSHLIKGFQLSSLEKQQLMAFLNALTDTSNLHLEHWKDPFKKY